jgi:hypothetical protein
MQEFVKKQNQESLFCTMKTKYENIENEWVHKKGSPDLIS